MRTLNNLSHRRHGRMLPMVLMLTPCLWWAPHSLAATQTVKVEAALGDHAFDTLNGDDASISPTGGYLKNMTYQDTVRVSHAADGLPGGFALYAAFDTLHSDDNQIMLRNYGGKEFSLKQLGETADSQHAAGAVTATVGHFEFKLDGRTSVGHDLYFTKQLTAAITGIFLEEGLRVGVQLSRSDSDQPLTTFIDRDFKTKYRPTEIISQTNTLHLEQIIGERNKARVELFTLAPTAERPRAIGERLKTATALDSTLFVKTTVGHIQEQRNEALKNDRGYFDLNSLSLGMAWEAIYDLMLECEGTIMKENEVDPRVDENKSLVSRSLGLGASFKRFNPGIELGGLYTRLETNESFYSIQGAIIWNF